MDEEKKKSYLEELEAIDIRLKKINNDSCELSRRKTQLMYNIKSGKINLDSVKNELDLTTKLLAECVEIRKQLWQQKLFLDKELLFLNLPDGQSDELDLRLMYIGRYGIYLHGEKTMVGTIDYRGKQDVTLQGDIGYSINPAYRGHNYAYKALCILSDILSKKGISDFFISTHKDNEPSRKTIEKYGGELVSGDWGDVLIFRCLTRENEYCRK